MQFKYNLNPYKVALLLGVLSLYLALQSLIGEYLLENVVPSGNDSIVISFIDLLSVNAEETIPTWYSTLLLYSASMLLALIAAIKLSNRDPFKYHWLGLAITFLYLSMDEGAVIHEIFADPLQAAFNTSGYLAFGWQIIFVPLVILFALLYLRFLVHLPARIRNLFLAAGLIYVGGAVLVEAISANRWYIDGGVTFPYLAIGTVEELFEMLGVVLFIFALLSYMVIFQFTTIIGFATSTQPVSSNLAANSSGLKQPSFRIWLITGGIVLIVGLNVALSTWALGQRSEGVTADLQSIPFYQTVTDRYAGQGVIILGIDEILEPENPAAPPLAMSLLTLFDDVMVVTLPARRTSIAFAGHNLPFDQNMLSEIVSQSGEGEYFILGISDIRALAEGNSVEP
jgi:hypothetical protein